MMILNFCENVAIAPSVKLGQTLITMERGINGGNSSDKLSLK